MRVASGFFDWLAGTEWRLVLEMRDLESEPARGVKRRGRLGLVGVPPLSILHAP